MSSLGIDIFSYLDFRAFLQDYYLQKKPKGFSYRAFSKRVGLGSPSYLKLVIDGERNLSEEMARRFAQGLRLTREESSYFCTLVNFNQARSEEERKQNYLLLGRAKHYRKAEKIRAQHASYLSTWYMPAIRELAARTDFREDASWIARELEPGIKARQAQEALDVLLSLGLLRRNRDGRLEQGEMLLTTGLENRAEYIARYHREMMHRADAAIELIEPKSRDISSLTLCLSREGAKKLKERIQRFRRELLELEAIESHKEQVMQVNFQLFPLTKGSPADLKPRNNNAFEGADDSDGEESL